jgi:hypothetical protein
MYSQSYPIQRVEGTDTVVVLTLSQAAAMNSRFVKLKKDIDSLSVDYRGMKSVADSLATQNVRTTEMLRKALLEPKAAVRKANDQWIAGVVMYLWCRFVFFVSFEQ